MKPHSSRHRLYLLTISESSAPLEILKKLGIKWVETTPNKIYLKQAPDKVNKLEKQLIAQKIIYQLTSPPPSLWTK